MESLARENLSLLSGLQNSQLYFFSTPLFAEHLLCAKCFIHISHCSDVTEKSDIIRFAG